MQEGRVFPSKRDAWLSALLGVAAAAMVVGAVIQAAAPGPLGLRLGTPALMLAAAGFIGWVFTGTAYVVTQRELVVRSGPFRWTIPLQAIESIRPTRSPLSAPALSLDRLAVKRIDRWWSLVISPEDKSGFLEEVLRRSGTLRREGDTLVRSG